MNNNKKYGYKFLWFIGNVFLALVILVPIVTILFYIKVTNLFDWSIGIEQYLDIFISLYFVGLLIFYLWVLITNKWKNWALNSVKEKERFDLENKIYDEKSSIVIKQWVDISKKGKIIRITVIALLFIGATYLDYQRSEKKRALKNEPENTIAKITSVEQYFDKNKYEIEVNYSFKGKDSTVYKGTRSLESGFVVSNTEKNGFEIQEGDLFNLEYQSSDPENHKLDFCNPSGVTLVRNISLTTDKITPLFSDVDINCLVVKVYKKFGLKGLAILYNFDLGYWENENFNKYKFQIFTSRDNFTKIIDECAVNK